MRYHSTPSLRYYHAPYNLYHSTRQLLRKGITTLTLYTTYTTTPDLMYVNSSTLDTYTLRLYVWAPYRCTPSSIKVWSLYNLILLYPFLKVWVLSECTQLHIPQGAGTLLLDSIYHINSISHILYTQLIVWEMYTTVHLATSCCATLPGGLPQGMDTLPLALPL